MVVPSEPALANFENSSNWEWRSGLFQSSWRPRADVDDLWLEALPGLWSLCGLWTPWGWPREPDCNKQDGWWHTICLTCRYLDFWKKLAPDFVFVSSHDIVLMTSVSFVTSHVVCQTQQASHFFLAPGNSVPSLPVSIQTSRTPLIGSRHPVFSGHYWSNTSCLFPSPPQLRSVRWGPGLGWRSPPAGGRARDPWGPEIHPYPYVTITKVTNLGGSQMCKAVR